MQHFNQKINFANYAPFEILVYNISFACLPEKQEDLKRFVVTHYSKADSVTKSMCMSFIMYQLMIDSAIKSNNIVGLEILWQGIYYHDRDYPSFEHDVYLAAEHSDLKTFQHVLYGYMNYCTLNPLQPLNVQRLKSLAHDGEAKLMWNNGKIEQFIDHIAKSYSHIEPMPIDPTEIDEDDSNMIEKVKEFYHKINTFEME